MLRGYLFTAGVRTPIFLIGEGDDLILLGVADRSVIDRWPFAEVEEILESDTLQLRCPPRPLQVEIIELDALAREPWEKRLPTRAAHSSTGKGLLWVATAVGGAFGIVAGLPLLLSLLPRSIESKLLAGASSSLLTQRCGTPTSEGNKALEAMTARLYPREASDRDFSVHVSVLRRPSVNAVAYPNGEIFLFAGLLKQARDPDEIAGVLAHEIEHVKRRHATERLLREALLLSLLHLAVPGIDGQLSLVQALLSLQFSRTQEREADEGALARLHRASIPPGALQKFFARLAKDQSAGLATPELLSTHPADSGRAERASRYADDKGPPSLTASQWHALRQLCDSNP